MSMSRPPVVSSARYRSARAWTSLWRFGTLPFARRLFANAPAPTVLQRPMFGFTFLVDVSRTDTHRLLYLDGQRFVAERNLIRSLLRPGMRVVDVGANLGYFLLLLESVIGPRGEVVCLEPEPDNLRELARNVRVNGLGNVVVLPIAAGDCDGFAPLRRGINAVVNPGGSESFTVPLRRLDSLLSAPVDFIKIDVEGFELQVLRGAQRVLQQRPTVVVEVHPGLLDSTHRIAEILELLTQHHRVAAYRPRIGGPAARKLAVRYLGAPGFEALPPPALLLAACASGEITDPFWVVARS
jgi:FkbM family methyltransferase